MAKEGLMAKRYSGSCITVTEYATQTKARADNALKVEHLIMDMDGVRPCQGSWRSRR